MTRKTMWLFAISIVVGCLSQAQQNRNSQNSNEIIFPGPTERPSRFPLSTKKPPSTTTSAGYQQCVDNCITTSEYNPVCGTDKVFYTNPGKLGCAKNCGKRVEISNYGQCQ